MNRKVLSLVAAVTISIAVVGGFGMANANAATAHPPFPGKVPSGCTNHTWGYGLAYNSGTCVRWIQTSVNFNNWAYDNHGRITVDGSYGPATESAVVAFQNACNAALRGWGSKSGYMSGGQVGTNTWIALETDCYQG